MVHGTPEWSLVAFKQQEHVYLLSMWMDGWIMDSHTLLLLCIIYFCSPYLNEGFMQLEKIINEAIIELKTGKQVNIDVSVRVRHL